MKTNLFDNRCERDHSVLWIGATNHQETEPVFRWCQDHCDMIAVRPSIRDAIDSPPRSAIDQVLIARTNRWDGATSPNAGNLIADLRHQHSAASFLLVRGSLVAPTVTLPPTDAPISGEWIESISTNEAITYLDARRRDRPSFGQPPHRAVTPVVVIASHYAIAEAFLDAISIIDPAQRRWATWQRQLNPSVSRGVATILWDDSVATPATGEQWQRRLGASPHSRHFWSTGIATTAQREVAQENGVVGIIEKPGRLDCLIEVLG